MLSVTMIPPKLTFLYFWLRNKSSIPILGKGSERQKSLCQKSKKEHRKSTNVQKEHQKSEHRKSPLK